MAFRLHPFRPFLPGFGLTRHNRPHPTPPPAHPALPSHEPPFFPSHPGLCQRLRLAAPSRHAHLQFHGNGRKCGRDRLRKPHRRGRVGDTNAKYYRRFLHRPLTRRREFRKRHQRCCQSFRRTIVNTIWELDVGLCCTTDQLHLCKLLWRRHLGVRQKLPFFHFYLSSCGSSQHLYYRDHPNPPEQHDDVHGEHDRRLGPHDRILRFQ